MRFFTPLATIYAATLGTSYGETSTRDHPITTRGIQTSPSVSALDVARLRLGHYTSATIVPDAALHETAGTNKSVA